MANLTGTKGGSGVWQRIISEMPDHDVYIEAFWGRGTIAKKKRPANVTIGVDLDPDAISSGVDVAMMFECDSLKWLRSYFMLDSGVAAFGDAGPELHPDSRVSDATFGGAKLKRHLVYMDPPYLGFEHYYKFGVDHKDVIDVFLALPCPAMISGYHS